MAVEETIAVIGIKKDTETGFIGELVKGKFRLLIIPSSKSQMLEFKKKYGHKKFPAAIEILDCAKDGCWESETIVFVNPVGVEKELIGRIKEVAVQKTIVAVFEAYKPAEIVGEVARLQELLPNSKLVQVLIAPEKQEASVAGKNKEAVDKVLDMLEKISYHIESPE